MNTGRLTSYVSKSVKINAPDECLLPSAQLKVHWAKLVLIFNNPRLVKSKTLNEISSTTVETWIISFLYRLLLIEELGAKTA